MTIRLEIIFSKNDRSDLGTEHPLNQRPCPSSVFSIQGVKWALAGVTLQVGSKYRHTLPCMRWANGAEQDKGKNKREQIWPQSKDGPQAQKLEGSRKGFLLPPPGGELSTPRLWPPLADCRHLVSRAVTKSYCFKATKLVVIHCNSHRKLI